MNIEFKLDVQEWEAMEALLRARNISRRIHCSSGSSSPYFTAHLFNSLHRLTRENKQRMELKRPVVIKKRGFKVPTHMEQDLIQLANSSGLTMSRLAMRTIVNPLLLDLFYDGSKEA